MFKAIAHPNFALIKYWGKSDYDSNVPAMSSVSITLDSMKSETTVSFPNGLSKDRWILNGIEQLSLGQIESPLQSLKKIASIEDFCQIESNNDFPTAAGLASSASGIASLVTALNAAFELNLSTQQLVESALEGSGSAPRSLFSGYVYLEALNDQVRCKTVLDPEQWPLEVIVCITSNKKKFISSRKGMEITKQTSPKYWDWVNSQEQNVAIALNAIEAKNFEQLRQVSEQNCLEMHKVMQASDPPINYWNEITYACVEKVREIQDRGLAVFFTIDAGPQVKIICESDASEEVLFFMKRESGIQSIIQSGLGQGSRIIYE